MKYWTNIEQVKRKKKRILENWLHAYSAHIFYVVFAKLGKNQVYINRKKTA